jgi:hypothetical protein
MIFNFGTALKAANLIGAIASLEEVEHTQCIKYALLAASRDEEDMFFLTCELITPKQLLDVTKEICWDHEYGVLTESGKMIYRDSFLQIINYTAISSNPNKQYIFSMLEVTGLRISSLMIRVAEIMFWYTGADVLAGTIFGRRLKKLTASDILCKLNSA